MPKSQADLYAIKLFNECMPDTIINRLTEFDFFTVVNILQKAL